MKTFLLTAGFAVVFSVAASASTIDILDEYGVDAGPLTTFYTGNSDTVNNLNSGFTSSDISGANLVVLAGLTSNLNSGQLAAIDSFVTGGGNLVLMSDAAGFETLQGTLNNTLTSLGSTMVNVDGSYDSGYQTTTTIASNPFTTGVTSLEYGYTSAITGGTALVTGVGGQVFVATEQIGSGNVFAIADLDTADVNTISNAGNQQFYCNVAGDGCALSGAPEPGTFGLAGLAVAGAFAMLRRKKA